MSALLPSENQCCNPCTEPTTTAVPGPSGDAGASGSAGTNGVDAFTTASSFVMPAELANVTITVANSTWMLPDQILWIQGGGFEGFFQVQSKPDSTHAIVKNLKDTGSSAYLVNSAPGSVFPALTGISPAGVQGPAGSSGAPSNASYITQVPEAGLSAEQALSLLATGYMKSTTVTGVVSTQAVPIPVADGGTGGITAAAARTALGVAPLDATFITQTPNAELSAEQALSALATGYMKVTTVTGVVSSQAVPIPVADGGTNAITAAAARASLGLLSGYGLLAFKDSVNLNSAGSDNAITMLSARYRIDKITVESPSLNVTTATAGLFTAAGGAGTTLAADQSLAALTAASKFLDLTKDAILNTDRRTEATLYFRVGTAQGAAATANVRIYGWAFDQGV